MNTLRRSTLRAALAAAAFCVALPWSADAPAQAVRSALNQAMNDQALRARLSDLGTEPAWDEADTVAKAIAADLMRWGQLARAAKIEVPQ